MKEVRVELERDHLERMVGGRKPVAALAELVWNALDADAIHVDVEIEENSLGGIESIRVIDDGHGIPYDAAMVAFAKLGGSQKRAGMRSPAGRFLHGRAGEGRFCAFGVGDQVRWKSRWSDAGVLKEYTIDGSLSDLGRFRISDPKVVKKGRAGTEVLVSKIDKPYVLLKSEKVTQQFTETFALYMREYPDLRISYDGRRVDPSLIESSVVDYEVGPVTLNDGRAVKATLTVIEWKISVERALLLCDGGGFVLNRKPPGIQAPNFNFTVYLKTDFLRELEAKHLLDLEDLEPDLGAVLNAAKVVLRDHFRRRADENANQVVERWKAAKVYPFEGPPRTVLEEVERKVFDVVALNINNALPDFGAGDAKGAKLSLFMLKQSLEQSPHEVRRIVQEVLELPKDKQSELSELLERTTLTAIINASKVVADRLSFLAGLDVLIFDPKSNAAVLERKQLHRILAENTWIFGEEFNLTVDDQGLTEVLRKHLESLGRDSEVNAPVKTVDGSDGVVDLMLSRLVPQPKEDEREHLVVELKRPSKSIDAAVATQIEKYAFAVAEDERFRDTKTRWVFWAVSTEIDAHVRRKATNQAHRPDGVLFQAEDQRIIIWVKTWGQVIESCRSRLRFFQERLQYMADKDAGLEHLQKTYDKYLPKHLKTPVASPATDQ